MRFDGNFLEEIKARLRPSDVIGRTVKLRRQGREYVGLSPFNKEKSPSFYVNDEKGFFHDFSSGKHGDLIAFLQETQRLSFREAIEQLAAEAGIPLPSPDPREAAAERQRQDLYGWLDEAARWFEAQLRRPIGEAARRYLDGRVLPEGDRVRFRLGYAPLSRTALKDHLIAKGAHPGELVDAGLLIAPEDGSAPYDRFRDRIIFPISDARNRIISFGGRALDPEARAKYLNGPETALFHKGSTLYGLHEARRLLHIGGEDAPLVVVEGYMDVIACQRADIASVAPLGTALTEEQIAALWRIHPSPTLSFDSDAAGSRAEGRVMDRALPLLKPGYTLRFATVLGGKDPDDILRTKGVEALKLQVSVVRSLSQALFERERYKDDLSTPDQRAALKVRLRRLAQSISDRDLAEQYGRDFLDRFYELFQRKRYDGGQKFDLSRNIRGLIDKGLYERLTARMRTFNAAVAFAAAQQPIWARPHIEDLVRFGFGDERLSDMVQPLIDALYEENPTHEMVVRNIAGDGAMPCLQLACKHALEVDVYPFVGPKVPSERAQKVWVRSFEALVHMALIEAEFAERRKALKEREPILDEQFLIQRGMELRASLTQLAAAISEGTTVWMDT